MNMACLLRYASCAALLSSPFACAHQTPPPEPPVPKASSKAGVTLVQVAVDPGAAHVPPPRVDDDAEAAIIAVLDQAQPRAVSCYQAALKRDPYVYGEVLVRLELGDDGALKAAEAVMDTVGDNELVSCVERLVASLRYPRPRSALEAIRYPFLFTSDLTPPEVVRAMKAADGLIEEEEQGTVDVDAPDGGPPVGTVETW